MSKKDLEMAEQQILGFAHAKAGYGITELAESMGLECKEWEVIRDRVSLTKSDIEELDEHFSR